MSTLIHQRVQLCREGKYEKRVCKISSGWVVMGDVQFLPGYCLLLPDPVVANLNALSEEARKTFLLEMSVVGDCLLELTDAVRINYEMIGNVEPALHAHIFPRFDTEPEEFRLKPAWFYDWEKAVPFSKDRDQGFVDELTSALERRGLVISHT